ncbi:hypothetical protein HK099_007803 [Clydaea vesicula]|uniref:Ras guanine nucleotide exchange factor n=1 Tax=Clydaea vesicula TaxID=447962 RepID=A0AAD5XXA4_9FUNG|nr:hypothetical protein HK099_007803 [Clydaea vesicula]
MEEILRIYETLPSQEKPRITELLNKKLYFDTSPNLPHRVIPQKHLQPLLDRISIIQKTLLHFNKSFNLNLEADLFTLIDLIPLILLKNTNVEKKTNLTLLPQRDHLNLTVITSSESLLSSLTNFIFHCKSDLTKVELEEFEELSENASLIAKKLVSSVKEITLLDNFTDREEIYSILLSDSYLFVQELDILVNFCYSDTSSASAKSVPHNLEFDETNFTGIEKHKVPRYLKKSPSVGAKIRDLVSWSQSQLSNENLENQRYSVGIKNEKERHNNNFFRFLKKSESTQDFKSEMNYAKSFTVEAAQNERSSLKVSPGSSLIDQSNVDLGKRTSSSNQQQSLDNVDSALIKSNFNSNSLISLSSSRNNSQESSKFDLKKNTSPQSSTHEFDVEPQISSTSPSIENLSLNNSTSVHNSFVEISVLETTSENYLNIPREQLLNASQVASDISLPNFLPNSSRMSEEQASFTKTSSNLSDSPRTSKTSIDYVNSPDMTSHSTPKRAVTPISLIKKNSTNSTSTCSSSNGLRNIDNKYSTLPRQNLVIPPAFLGTFSEKNPMDITNSSSSSFNGGLIRPPSLNSLTAIENKKLMQKVPSEPTDQQLMQEQTPPSTPQQTNNSNKNNAGGNFGNIKRIPPPPVDLPHYESVKMFGIQNVPTYDSKGNRIGTFSDGKFIPYLKSEDSNSEEDVGDTTIIVTKNLLHFKTNGKEILQMDIKGDRSIVLAGSLEKILNVLTRWIQLQFEEFEDDIALVKLLENFINRLSESGFSNEANFLKRIFVTKATSLAFQSATLSKTVVKLNVKTGGNPLLEEPSPFPVPTSPNLLDFSPLIDVSVKDVAKYLTVCDVHSFRSISTHDLICKLQNSDYNVNNSVDLCVTRSNVIKNWVALEICSLDKVKLRKKVILKFIAIAHACLELNNFNSCLFITLGLLCPAVQKLKSSWELIQAKELTNFKSLELLLDPTSNMKNYRILLSQSSSPFIPFIPILIKDLKFLLDGNSKTVGEDLINFELYRSLIEIIEYQFGMLKFGYPFQEQFNFLINHVNNSTLKSLGKRHFSKDPQVSNSSSGNSNVNNWSNFSTASNGNSAKEKESQKSLDACFTCHTRMRFVDGGEGESDSMKAVWLLAERIKN